MRLAATILAGGDRENEIVAAIESAALLVDHYILIDTGESAQKAIAVAIELLGERCTVFRYPHEEFDCATARDFALKCATDLGFDWALILDTDERIHGKAGTIRRMLAEVTTDSVIVVNAENDCYRKTRFVRLPAVGTWEGRVHEAFVGGEFTLARGASFSELPKTAEQQAERNAWIERVTREELEKRPNDARMLYYHGDALMGLGRPDEAIPEFLACAKVSQWNEEVDWATYQAAMTHGCQKRLDAAFLTAAKSSLRIPELAWYAALCLSAGKEHDAAIKYAMLAARLGRDQRKTDRAGFVDKRTWYELPHEVIARSAKALGKTDLAEKAETESKRLRDERLSQLANLAA